MAKCMRCGEKLTLRYEWDRETVDEHGDILDHDHRDTLSDFIDPMRPDERLVLVRDMFCEFDGLVDRGWAYVEDGKLPTRFDDGCVETHAVPKRFHKELESTLTPC